jgi:hypothetical protein
MADEGIPARLRFFPWPPGDPGPEIFAIIREIDSRQLLNVGRAVIATQIRIAEAHLEGMKQIEGILGQMKG